MNVISIQSQVAFGHVGNSAAVFPMQMHGMGPSLPNATIADDRVRCPEQGMGVSELGFAIRADVAGAIRERHHGLAQGFAARQF